MNKISYFLVFFFMLSCKDLSIKKTSSEVILNKELNTFNWNEVDVYPSFSICDDIQDVEAKKTCFTSTISNHIYTKLSNEVIIVNETINDTVLIEFQISEAGSLSFLNIEADTLTLQEIPNLKTLITTSIVDSPTIYPAIKRGQPVKSVFTLPLIIKVE